MVNLLEVVYGLTGLSTVITVVALLSGHRRAARSFGAVAIICAAIAALLYWYLSPKA